ncbi:hypothetical protein [Paenibacillus thermotolerans]|uniref:hypothetical protein n=1 Tax=Paenibacillus thermotolerans TaxID=3027807 RepID=UPI0023686014|nr:MULTISPECIES: hypothetical protein [unclassified Paenibacillus]
MRQQLLAALPEEHTRFTQLPNELGHNAVWDFVKSPDGRFFVSVCGENEKPLTALLYEYYPKTGELRLIFDVAKAWIVDAQQMPPSKIHTSIDFMPDGRLILATHNTAPAPGHKQWMFEQYYEHPWEGYPGSILMFVNPDTNEVQVRGIPVPRESVYGGMLGNDPRYYYFLGYMRGHFYRLDLETNEVKDYGKVSEFSSCRLVKDKKGRFYGSSYTGGIWRYDPETDSIQDVKASFTSPNGTKHRRQFIFAVHSPKDTIFMVDNMDGEMIELHPDTLEITRHGHIHLPGQIPVNPYGIGGLAADEHFVLYYGLKTFDGYCPIRLVRWDVYNGGTPENLGLITYAGKDSQYVCEMIFDSDGWLHMVDVCGEFSPYILAVDAKKLQPPGADAPAAALRPYSEPDYNGIGVPAYMHIVAEHTRTLPLHQHMDWHDTAVCHMRVAGGKLHSVNGRNRVLLIESDIGANAPSGISVLYDQAAPRSCVDADDGTTAVLTADGNLLIADLAAGVVRKQVSLKDGAVLAALICFLEKDMLLANDAEGLLHVIDAGGDGRSDMLPGVRLASEQSTVIRLDDERLLLSGNNDELLMYILKDRSAVMLQVKAPSVRGRSFLAAVTGGAPLADGTVVAGTYDGMLFSLSPDLRKRTCYGRLHSAGMLRNLIRLSGSEVVGVYGGERDAGHVFHFSPDSGFVDLGRPRVIKDNNDLRQIDAEWANIHFISCLAYSPEDDILAVGSGELYGSIVHYQGVVRPNDSNP